LARIVAMVWIGRRRGTGAFRGPPLPRNNHYDIGMP
jgi:hypothetical protein